MELIHVHASPSKRRCARHFCNAVLKHGGKQFASMYRKAVCKYETQRSMYHHHNFSFVTKSSNVTMIGSFALYKRQSWRRESTPQLQCRSRHAARHPILSITPRHRHKTLLPSPPSALPHMISLPLQLSVQYCSFPCLRPLPQNITEHVSIQVSLLYSCRRTDCIHACNYSPATSQPSNRHVRIYSLAHAAATAASGDQ